MAAISVHPHDMYSGLHSPTPTSALLQARASASLASPFDVARDTPPTHTKSRAHDSTCTPPPVPFLSMTASPHPPRLLQCATMASQTRAASADHRASRAPPPPRASDSVFSLAPVRHSAEWPSSTTSDTLADAVRVRSAGASPSPAPPLSGLPPRGPVPARACVAPSPAVLSGRVQRVDGGHQTRSATTTTATTAVSVAQKTCHSTMRTPSSHAWRTPATRPQSAPFSVIAPGPTPSSSALSEDVHARANPVRYRLAPRPSPSTSTTPDNSHGPSGTRVVRKEASPRTLSAPSHARRGPLHAATPQGRYEAGMRAYRYYQACQCRQSPGEREETVAAEGPDTSTSTMGTVGTVCVQATADAPVSGARSSHHGLHTTFITTDTAEVLRFSTDEDEDADDTTLWSATASPTNCLEETVTTPARPAEASGPLCRPADDAAAQAQTQEGAAYAARRRVRVFEDTYHSPRLHPTATPLLNALLSQVADDYFDACPPPSVVRAAKSRSASTSAECTDTPPPPPPAREGCVDLSAWLQRKEDRLAGRRGDEAMPDLGQGQPGAPCAKGIVDSGDGSGVHSPHGEGEGARGQDMRAHVDRVLTALARAHGRRLCSGHLTGTAQRTLPPRHGPRPHTTMPPSSFSSSSSSSSCSCDEENEEDDDSAEELDEKPPLTGDRPKARIPLPLRLAQCLRTHAPLLACVTRTARLVVYVLMRTLPTELYVGDPALFAQMRQVEKEGLLSLLRRVEASTPHAALQRARQRLANLHDRADRPPHAHRIPSADVRAVCEAEWRALSPGAALYIPALASMEALAWLLLPEGVHDLCTREHGPGGRHDQGDDDPHCLPTRMLHEYRAMVRDEPVCRVLTLLLSRRAAACEALATVLEETHVVTRPWSSTSTQQWLSGAAAARPSHGFPEGPVAELVHCLRVAAADGGHLPEPARQRALHVFYTSLGRTGSRQLPSAVDSADLLDLALAPCSLLTLAAATLLHVSDAPAQEKGAEEKHKKGDTATTTTVASSSSSGSVEGRPCCLHPQLVESHGGYGEAPFTGEAHRHMLQKRDLVCRLLGIAFTNTDVLASKDAAKDGVAVCAMNGATSPEMGDARSRASASMLDRACFTASSSVCASEGSEGSEAGSSRGTDRTHSPDTLTASEADRQAHHAYLHAALQPAVAYLPLEGVHHVLAASVAANAKVPLEWATEDVGPAELSLLLDLMESFSQLSMSLSSKRSAALTDVALEKKRQLHEGVAARPLSGGRRTNREDGEAAASAETVDAFFFEFHRQTLLKWCAVVCSEAAMSYAMELAGPGIADFAFITYDATTAALSESQCDTVMASPLAALALPSTLLLPESRHLAPIVLARCRRVVLEAVVKLKGEVMFLLTGMDARDRLLAVHHATLVGVQRAVEVRRQHLWAQRKHREGGHAGPARTPAAPPCAETTAEDAAHPSAVLTSTESARRDNDVDDDEVAAPETAPPTSPPSWALEAARVALSTAARQHAEHALERTFLAFPLYARDGRSVVATVADIAAWTPPTPPTSHRASTRPSASPATPVDGAGPEGTHEDEDEDEADRGVAITDGVDLAIPDGLQLDAVYELMYAMEEARLVSNNANTLFNGTLMSAQGTARGFHPLGPQWRRAPPLLAKASSAKTAASDAPLFPNNTVTRTTAQRSAAARAAAAAKAIAHHRQAVAGPRFGERDDVDRVEEEADDDDDSGAALLRAMRAFVMVPRPCSSWFEVGKESFEASRLAARLRRSDAHHAFDLNSVSPLVALTTCVQPTPACGPATPAPSRPQSTRLRLRACPSPGGSPLLPLGRTADPIRSPLTPGDPHMLSPATFTAEPVTGPRPSRVLSRTAYADSVSCNPFLSRLSSSTPSPPPTAGELPTRPAMVERGRMPSLSPGRLACVAGQASATRALPPRHPPAARPCTSPRSRPGTGMSRLPSRPSTVTGVATNPSSRPTTANPWRAASLGRIGRIGRAGTAATAPVNTRAQGTRVSMRERLGFRVGEHLMPWTS